MDTKRCGTCKEIKCISKFHADKHRPDGLCSSCKECRKKSVEKNIVAWRKYRRQWYAKNKKRIREVGRKSQAQRWAKHPEHMKRLRRNRRLGDCFGISLAEYNRLLFLQGGKCLICETEKPGGCKTYMSVDHNHTTGKVRGILCGNCNTILGIAHDNPERLRKAADYLEEHSQ